MKRIMAKSGVLSILLLVSAGFTLNPPPALAQKGSGGDTLAQLLKPDVSYKANGLRDPFKSPVVSEMLTQQDNPNPVAPEVSLPELRIQGVFWGADFPQAIINDKVVKVGDEVSGAQIVSIDKDAITVFFVNRQFKILSPASSSSADLSRQGKKEGFNEK
jgi:hypothetical protein